MQATSTDHKTFQLLDEGKVLGELRYENMFMFKAEIKLSDSEIYEIKPAGFFGTSIHVSKDGAEIASLKMNWKGQIVFEYQDGRLFVFKAKGTFANKYIIEDKDEEKLIQYDPKFNWRKFQYNYDISYDKKPLDLVFVLLGVYASNYYLGTMAGAM